MKSLTPNYIETTVMTICMMQHGWKINYYNCANFMIVRNLYITDDSSILNLYRYVFRLVGNTFIVHL